VLPRTDLDHRFMGFELNHEISGRKSAEHRAVPLKHPDIVDIFDRFQNRKFVEQMNILLEMELS
jgi:hypothetical protein